MHILKNVPLKLYSTMRLGGTAANLVEVKTKAEVRQAETWAEEHQLPVIMIGGGSNIIWRDDGFHGLLIVNKIPGFKKIDEDDASVTIEVGAGRVWDKTVERAVSMGLSGIESLSLIPGSTGAAPVQNIGAYGQEISQTLVSLEAYDRFVKDFVVVNGQDCAFGYRTSRFKTVDKGRFLITSLTLRLSKIFTDPPTYKDLEAYYHERDISEFSPEVVRKAVMAIRTKKLPDPAKVANTGSFFGNPVITKAQFKKILKKNPGLEKAQAGWSQKPYWELPDGKIKLSAGRLVELAGFANHKDPATGMAIWPAQSLVFVNQKARHTSDLLDFRQKVTDKVEAMFGILLEQEPELLP